MSDSIFSERLRALRKARKQTLQDVADGSGLAKSFICEMEKGDKHSPSLKTLRSLAAHFRLPMGVLLGDEEDLPISRLRGLLNEVRGLPPHDQEFIARMIAAFLATRPKAE